MQGVLFNCLRSLFFLHSPLAPGSPPALSGDSLNEGPHLSQQRFCPVEGCFVATLLAVTDACVQADVR